MYLSILDISNIMENIHSPLPITSKYRIIRQIQKKPSFRQYDTENEKLLEKHLVLMFSLFPGKKRKCFVNVYNTTS